MHLHRTLALVLVAGAATLIACGSGRSAESLALTTCTSCHGGKDNASGAPPNDLHGNTATTAMGVGQHTTHVNAGLACATCHPDRTAVQTAGHLDGKVDVELRGLAVGGGTAPAPRFDAATGTCSSVYCHGATLPGGAQRAAPVWTERFTTPRCESCHGFPPAAGGHPAATNCFACHPDTVDVSNALKAGGKHLDGVVDGVAQHPLGYADRSSAAFHGGDGVAFLGRQPGVRDCASCHGADLGGGVAPSCTACHEQAGWRSPSWQANCTFCHGTPNKAFAYSAALDQAAPPQGVDGEATGEGVGAHRAHLTGGGVSTPIACATCHDVPTPAAPLDHVDGAIALTLPAGATWSASSQTCATACHGAAGSPAWTSTAPLGCDGCHGAPPATGRHPGSEPKHAFMGANCGICHGDVAGVAPTLLDKSRHLDGTVEVRLSVGTFNGTGCATACHGTLTPFPWAKP